MVRHAQASTLDLHYRWQGEGVHLLASDNGRGADGLVAGNGLRGMRERLQAYGGTVEIETRPGQGFSLSLHLPVSEAHDRTGVPLRVTGQIPAVGTAPMDAPGGGG